MLDQSSVKDSLEGTLGNRAASVKRYYKYYNIWKLGLKYLKKQIKIIFRMAKLSGSRREINTIKNIKTKASKKHYSYSNNISKSDLDSSISSDSE